MARKSLKEIAEADRQVARFLKREAASDLNDKSVSVSQVELAEVVGKLAYAQNHLPKARNLSEAAQNAINACIHG